MAVLRRASWVSEAGTRLGPALATALIGVDQRLAAPAAVGNVGPLDPRSLAWTDTVRQAVPAIRAELDGYLGDGPALPTTDEVAGSDQGATGEWTTLVLAWNGMRVEDTCARFPATMAALASVPHVQGVGFTVLGPGAHLARHQGPVHSLRYLLAITVPDGADSCRMVVGDTLCDWREGGEVLFDDRTPHEAWNDGGSRRYLLFVQTRLPVPGLRGVAHRATQWAFGRLTRGIARRAAEAARRTPPAGPVTPAPATAAPARPAVPSELEATLVDPPPTFADPALDASYQAAGYVTFPALTQEQVGTLIAAHTAEIADLGDELMAIDYDRADRSRTARSRELIEPLLAPIVEARFLDHRIVFASFVAKHPGTGSFMAMHEDRSWVDERRFRSGTLWIPLHPVGPGIDNGGLEVVPHSHQLALGWSGSGTPDLLGAYRAELDHHLVRPALDPGTAVFCDSRTLHASPPNATEGVRLALVCTIVPREASLIHVVAGQGALRRIHSVDEAFYIRYGPDAAKQGMPAEYPVIEELEDHATVDRARVDQVLSRAVPDPSGGRS